MELDEFVELDRLIVEFEEEVNKSNLLFELPNAPFLSIELCSRVEGILEKSDKPYKIGCKEEKRDYEVYKVFLDGELIGEYLTAGKSFSYKDNEGILTKKNHVLCSINGHRYDSCLDSVKNILFP